MPGSQSRNIERPMCNGVVAPASAGPRLQLPAVVDAADWTLLSRLRQMRIGTVASWIFLGMAFISMSACRQKIGDPCKSSFQCAPSTFDRSCDATYLVDGQGECTIEGCRFGECPKEAVCVLVYNTRYLSSICDPEREDFFPDENRCSPYQQCLPEGLCVDQAQGRTSCRLECDKNSDCRSGYKCVTTGGNGLYVAPDSEHLDFSRRAKICVPDPQ